MKKLFVFLLSLPLLLGACSSSNKDHDDDTYLPDILGTWQLVDMNLDMKSNSLELDAMMMDFFNNVDYQIYWQEITFYADRTLVSIHADEDFPGMTNTDEGEFALKSNREIVLKIDGELTRAKFSFDNGYLNIIQDLKKDIVAELREQLLDTDEYTEAQVNQIIKQLNLVRAIGTTVFRKIA